MGRATGTNRKSQRRTGKVKEKEIVKLEKNRMKIETKAESKKEG